MKIDRRAFNLGTAALLIGNNIKAEQNKFFKSYLKILECKHLPISVPILGNQSFMPGFVANINTVNGITYDKLFATVSDGSSYLHSYPYGIIDDIRDKEDDSTISTGMITIWNAPGFVFETLTNEPVDSSNDVLYVSPNGLLTSKKYKKDCFPVARLIEHKTKQNGTMIKAQWKCLNIFEQYKIISK